MRGPDPYRVLDLAIDYLELGSYLGRKPAPPCVWHLCCPIAYCPITSRSVLRELSQ